MTCRPSFLLFTIRCNRIQASRQCLQASHGVSHRLGASCFRFSTTVATPDSKPFYVTTPIFYVNAAPHVGHLYSMVLADTLKRWHVLTGRQSILCTGTDEHGMKVQRAADRAKTEPQAFCDQGAEVFKDLAEAAELHNGHFIRTTDLQHKEAVQHAWRALRQKDMIYLSKHEGWYSVSDETFYPESAVHLMIEPQTGRKIMASIETGKEVEWTSETNYRFRLSSMRESLLQLYEDHPKFIVPDYRMNDVVSQVSQGLEDLSVSRPSSRLRWGIPVPDDESQTIYVWLDALVNYITVAGFPWAPGQESAKGWPADCHVVGKDIVRFHCIYWPAFLLALEVSPPKQILTHGHWTLGREKMAKSTGNVVNPFFAIDRFGVDVMRYYLTNDGGIAQDADYTNEFIINRYKNDLQGSLGNLSSRITRGKGWSVRRAVEKAAKGSIRLSQDDQLVHVQVEMLQELPSKVAKRFDELHPGRALQEVMRMISATNAFTSHAKPWAIAKGLKTAPERKRAAIEDQLDTYIFLCAESLRFAAILLQPFMPNKAAHLAEMLGIKENRRTLEWVEVGKDDDYGTSKIDLGAGIADTLFPPLINDR